MAPRRADAEKPFLPMGFGADDRRGIAKRRLDQPRLDAFGLPEADERRAASPCLVEENARRAHVGMGQRDAALAQPFVDRGLFMRDPLDHAEGFQMGGRDRGDDRNMRPGKTGERGDSRPVRSSRSR